MAGSLVVLNWNIGGAKYLDSNSGLLTDKDTREWYRKRLNKQLKNLLTDDGVHPRPDIVTLQEVVEYRACDDRKIQRVIDPVPGYEYFFTRLIDTDRHSHQGKWRGTREKGKWYCFPEEPKRFDCAVDQARVTPCKNDKHNCKKVYFAQGNAILVRTDFPRYPVWELPLVTEAKARQEEESARTGLSKSWRGTQAECSSCVEVVQLECGLYFGDRNTEPRAALVTHVVLPELGGEGIKCPLDLFVVNLHLTTLMGEREGVPDIDEEAAKTRMRQLNLVLNDTVSRYNLWRKNIYRLRSNGKTDEDLKKDPRHQRCNPVWIIAGDFNCTPESLEYQTLVRRGFVDMMPKINGEHVLTKSRGLHRPAEISLDYVFAGPRFEAISPSDVGQTSRVLHELDASDHKPLLVEIPIRPRVPETEVETIPTPGNPNSAAPAKRSRRSGRKPRASLP